MKKVYDKVIKGAQPSGEPIVVTEFEGIKVM